MAGSQRMTMMLRAAAVLLFLIAPSARALDDISLGHAIFTGAVDGLEFRLGKAAEQVARFPCHRCHGRDGLGGKEGDVPAIAWPLLGRPNGTRPGYDRAAFGRAVRDGITAAGRELSRIMLRYDLDDDAMTALGAYLEALPDWQGRGVSATSLVVGVPVLADAPELGRRYVRRLQQSLDRLHGDAGIYGRAIRVMPLEGDPDAILKQAEAEVIAVIGLPVDDRLQPIDFARRGIPVLFPLGPFEGDEDASIMRTFMPSRLDAFEALASEIAQQRPTALTIMHDRGSSGAARMLQQVLRLAHHERTTRFALLDAGENQSWPPDLSDLVLLGGAAPALRSMPPETRLWLTARHLQAVEAAPSGSRITLMLDAPGLVDRAVATGVDVIDAHAAMAATALIEALKVAGRAVTRTTLVQALDEAPLDSLGLDYAKARLSGTKEIRFISLDPP